MSIINFHPVSNDLFVGLKLNENCIDFYYPIELDNRIKTNKKLCYKFLQTIGREVSIFQAAHNNVKNFDALFSMQWLLMDYKKNGIQNIKVKKISNNFEGRIEWKKIISESTPIISDNNYIFKKIYSSRNIQTENEIIRIYKYCLKYSSDIIGWIYEVFYQIESLIDLKHSLNILKKALSITYNDSYRIKLTHLLNILEFIDYKAIDNSLITFGVNNYHPIYERMLVETIQQDHIKISMYYPKGIWEIDGDRLNASTLRPDFIFEDEDHIIIFDAKFYRRNNKTSLSGLPSSGDIQKQVIYGEYIKSISSKKIYNSFVLPGNVENGIEYYGKSYLEGINNEYFHTIVSMKIDLEKLINNYLSNKKIDSQQLLNIIISNSFH